MTRREYLALGGLALASACGRKVGAGYPGYALIATSGEPTVSVVDLSAFGVAKQIKVGGNPRAVLPGSRTNGSLVLTPETGSVHLLNGQLNRVTSRKIADHLSGFQLVRGGKTLMAISGPAKTLFELDAANLRVVKQWKLSAEPVTLDVSSEGDVGISTGEHGTVEFLHRKTGVLTKGQLAGALGEVRFRSDGKLMLAANRTDRSLTAFSVPSLEVLADLPVAMQPQNLCFNSDGGQLFVSGPGMDGVAIVTPFSPLEVEQTVLAGREPGAMACSANPAAYLFVASASASNVCILNVPTRKVLGVVEVGQKPSFITVTPDNQYALVLNRESGDMAVIHLASIAAKMGNAARMRNKSGASLFTMLPVGDQPVHAAIVPKQV